MKKLLSVLLILALCLPLMAASPTSPYTQPHSGLFWRAHLYTNTPGFQIAFGGLTTGSANNDTLYIAAYDWDGDGSGDYIADQFEGYGIDDYIGGGDFMVRVCMTADSAAPVFEERPLVAFDSDAGMVIVSPTFTAAVGADEYVMVIHRSVVGRQKGLLRYHGTIDLLDGEAAGITDGDDSLYVPDLAGFGDDYWELGNFWLHFTKTTDGAAPQNQWRPVLNSVSATGCMTFTTAFTVEATTLDEVELVHESLVPANVRPGAMRYRSIAALRAGTAGGIDSATDSVYADDLVGDFIDEYFTYGDYWIHVVQSTDGALPQDEWRAVTKWTSSTGLVLFSPDISVEFTEADEFELVHYSEVPVRYTVGWSEWTEVVIDLSSATWNSVATHEVIAGTGDYELEIAMTCSTNCSSTSSDSLWFFLGESGATGFRMISALIEDIDAGEGLIPVNGWGIGYVWTAENLVTTQSGIIRIACHMGKDVGYQIDDHAGAGGIITVFFRSRPLSTGGTAAAGAGGSL